MQSSTFHRVITKQNVLHTNIHTPHKTPSEIISSKKRLVAKDLKRKKKDQ